MGVPPRQTSTHILSQYLVDAYEPGEFLRFLRCDQKLEGICVELSVGASPAEFFTNAVLALVRRKLVTEEIFHQLKASRPERRDELEALEATILGSKDTPPPAPLVERYGADSEIELSLKIPLEKLTAAHLEEVLASFRSLAGNPDIITVQIRAGSTILRFWCRYSDYQTLLRALDRARRPLVYEVETVSFRRSLPRSHYKHPVAQFAHSKEKSSGESTQTETHPLDRPPSDAVAISANEKALRRERDLYLRLLELNTRETIEPFLVEALQVLCETSGAARGYIEFYRPESRDFDPSWSHAQGIPDAELLGVRAKLSSNLIAGPLANGEMVESAGAVDDSRFADHKSVRENGIRTVLCVSIGRQEPVGVLYVEGRAFDATDRRRVQAFAQHVAPHVGRIIAGHSQREQTDPTRDLRKDLAVEALVGRSEALAQVLRGLSFAAKNEALVLLEGPSGVGKSLVARLIHNNGARGGASFVSVHCGETEALAERLCAGPSGFFTQAAGGTLFLEEIGELPLVAQQKLLALLMGPGQDVRVLASSAMDLGELVRTGELLSELFFRLQVLKIALPPLSDRVDDISELAQHFCAQICRQRRLPRLRLSLGAIKALETHEWTSNVAELERTIQAAAVLAAEQGLNMIAHRHVFPNRYRESPDSELSYSEATRRYQRRFVERTLMECGGNVAKAARRLDLARSHVYNLISGFDIKRYASDAGRRGRALRGD